ncbi:MAG: ABC transporter ATP-binding protein [Verrucomicrobiota bacterium]
MRFRLFEKQELAHLKRSAKYIKPFKKLLILALVFGAIAGPFNALMLFVFKAIIDFALIGEITAEGPAGKIVEAAATEAEDSASGLWGVMGVCGIIPLMMAGRGLLTYLNRYFMILVSNKALQEIRREVYEKLMAQSLKFFNQRKSGHLIQTLFNQSQMLSKAGVTLVVDAVKHPVAILSYVVALFSADWMFAICALFVFPLCMFPVIYFGNRVRHSGRNEEEQAGQLLVRIQESMAGIKLIKSYAREPYEEGRFQEASDGMIRMQMRWTKALEIVPPLVETVASLGIAAGLVYASSVGMEANDFWFRYITLIAMYPHVKAFSRLQIQTKRFMIAANGVFSVIDAPVSVEDDPEAKPASPEAASIRFDEVTFSYSKKVSAVKNFTFDFQKNCRYALVGESGAGKSTLFSLILRFYDPRKGNIFLDEENLREIKQRELRKLVAFVSQDSFLFHDTIENNIRYGKLDATREEIEEAARKAHAHDFILAQEEGYETIVGDKGTKLSGGQQQRVSIARAFLKDAPILLLDEATSALDSESEQRIKEALDRLAEGKTVIAIAHRLATVLNSDCILFMKEGRLFSHGSHHQLVESCDGYRRVVELQFAQTV